MRLKLEGNLEQLQEAESQVSATQSGEQKQNMISIKHMIKPSSCNTEYNNKSTNENSKSSSNINSKIYMAMSRVFIV